MVQDLHKLETNKFDNNGSVKTIEQDRHNIPADYYLYNLQATPVISDTSEDDVVITINTNTGISNGDVVTFYEESNMFQSLIINNTPTTITLASGLDFAFTSNALVETGRWDMAVDGSGADVIYSIKAPIDTDLKVHTLNCSILDSTAMDDGKFGGISQLTNGVVFTIGNGSKKNLALVVNNLGFWEIGFSTTYSDKASAGQYGFRARRDITTVNGVVLNLEKGGHDEFRMVIRDDLSDLDLMTATINGHIC